MTSTPTPTDTNRPTTNWAIDYDAAPIEIRDPVAEALGVLEPGDPFVVTYEDLVTVAGHSCPTASGTYRMTQLGLDALYPEKLPVRSDIAVVLPGPRDDATYGLVGRLLSTITGAAGVDGFGGLGGGYGDRRNLLTYDGFEAETADPTVRFRRTDTDETVAVTYHVGDLPEGGPVMGNLQGILEGTASDDQRAAFADAWHARVQAVLSTDSLFTVE